MTHHGGTVRKGQTVYPGVLWDSVVIWFSGRGFKPGYRRIFEARVSLVYILALAFFMVQMAPVRAEAEGDVPGKIPRLTLAVLPFDTAGDATGGVWIYDGFVNHLINTNRFKVVERSRLDRVLEELNLGASWLSDPEQAARLGRIVAADFMLLPSIVKGDGMTRVTARLVDTESAEIFSAHETAELGTSALLLQVLLGRMAERIAEDLPLKQGLVIKTEGNVLYIDLGQESGLKRHTRLLLIDGSSESGRMVGEAKVLEVFENFLKAEAVRKSRPPAIMDRIRTK